MSLLVVGSIAFDTIETPVSGKEEVLGGSAVYFTAASSFLIPTQLVGVVGVDFDKSVIGFLAERNADLSGIATEQGKTFRWAGRYLEDMNTRETIKTELNVFGDFKPEIPDSFRDTKYIFLANINPDLQLDVLEQVKDPEFVALDTMNFWIEGSRPALEKVLKRVNCVNLNDSEAQEFTGEKSLAKAARIVAEMGPEIVIIKKGEHGAMMYYDGTFFIMPAYLLENVVDPTGAGDSFAGGFMGYVTRQRKIDRPALRMAMVYGTCMASFCCEEFGPGRLAGLTGAEIDARLEELKSLFSLE